VADTFAIATWNVNSVRTRLAHVFTFLHEHYPDVLCLQELKVEEKSFPFEAFARRGYHVAAHCQKTYNGVAIVSPYPIGEVDAGFGPKSDDTEARLIAATVRGVRVASAYVPNGQEVGSDKYRYKLNWMANLSDYLSARADPKRPVALCGDFNVAMDDRDVHDPKAWAGRVLFSEPEREAAARWQGWGLMDCFRRHHEEDGRFSWWDYRQGAFARNLGLRIDHVWATRPLWERCRACEIVKEPRAWDKPSDHAPVVAIFEAFD
jgi:exodeoxyribonuclease-3